MKSINCNLKTGIMSTVVDQYSTDNDVTKIVLDYTGTEVESWDKWLDLKMADGSASVQSLGITPIVEFTLTSAHTVVGSLFFQPYAKNGTQKYHFGIKAVKISKSLDVTVDTSTLKDDIIDYFNGRLTIKPITVNTVSPSTPANVTITQADDGLSIVADIPKGADGITQTKESLNIGSVDNTSDLNKPISNAVQNIFNNFCVNVKNSGAKGDGITDDTLAIQTVLNSMTSGGQIYFPRGRYKHTGLTIPAYCFLITGDGRYNTFLVNTSTNDAITINSNGERGCFRDIAIMGNGTSIYGSNATSGHGIVFSNNSVSWNFENVNVRGHGKDGFHGGELGHLNNINILNSEIEFNKGNGISLVPNGVIKSQINAINISGCNISNNGGSGLAIWGNMIDVSKNAIQGNRLFAFNINSDLIIGASVGTISCNMMHIHDNYEELNLFGCLNIKVDKVASPLLYKYIVNLIFENNFGNENVLDGSVTALTKIIGGSGIAGAYNNSIIGFVYRENSISTTASSVKLFNGSNLLNGSSILSTTRYEEGEFINFGQAQFIIKKKKIVFSNFFDAKGITVSDITNGKSNNITTNNTIIYYPLRNNNFNGWSEIGIPISTDYTNPQVLMSIFGRNYGSSGAYTTIVNTTYLVTIVNGILKVIPNGEHDETLFNYDDMYIKFAVYPTGGGGSGTYLYLYNPYIIYN